MENNLNNIMAEIGLTKKKSLNIEHRQNIPEGKVALYLDKRIIQKAMEWLVTADSTIEREIEHYLFMEATEKERLKKQEQQAMIQKEKENTFSMEDYYWRPKKEKTIFDELYRKPERNYSWLWGNEFDDY